MGQKQVDWGLVRVRRKLKLILQAARYCVDVMPLTQLLFSELHFEQLIVGHPWLRLV